MIKARRPKYVHKEQIETAKDNLWNWSFNHMFIIFIKNDSKDITESVLYTLQAVKDEIAREDSR